MILFLLQITFATFKRLIYSAITSAKALINKHFGYHFFQYVPSYIRGGVIMHR